MWVRGEAYIRFRRGKREGKRQFGRPRHRWEDNSKTDLQEVGCESMDWVGLRIGTGGGNF